MGGVGGRGDRAGPAGWRSGGVASERAAHRSLRKPNEKGFCGVKAQEKRKGKKGCES